MITIEACHNAASMQAYIANDEPGVPQYYVGNGYALAGIDLDTMDLSKFNRLIDNRVPDDKDSPKNRLPKLTPRDKKNRICGWNAALSPPKSWSIAETMHPDPAVREGLRQARIEADLSIFRDYFERSAQARENLNGTLDRDSGNLMALYVPHRFSRPDPDTGLPMPQAHGHLFLINATYDAARDKPGFVAAKVWYGRFLADASKAHDRRLREAAEGMGIKTADQTIIAYDPGLTMPVFRKSWKIAGITRDMEDKFSPRRDQVIGHMEAGIPRRKAKVKGRAAKPKLGMADIPKLVERWRGMLTPDERIRLARVGRKPEPKVGLGLPPVEPEKRFDFLRHAQRAVDALRGFNREGVTRGGPQRG